MRTLAGRYELRDDLSAGDNLVFRAWDNRIDREVAVKVPRRGSSAQEVDRFLDESRALAQLAHPNVIDVLEIGKFEDEGEQRPFCVMPYLHGIKLDRLLNEPGRPPLSIARVIALMTGVARGLHAVHQNHIVHGAINPNNILVMSDDSVKLVDIGIPVVRSPKGSPCHGNRHFYLAPEQVLQQRISVRTDVFVLGVIAYEALTGEHPFARETDFGTFQAILSETPIPVHEIRPETSRQISEIVAQALAKAPEQRFATTLDMLRALEDAERHVEAPPRTREALLDERFRLLTLKYSGRSSPAEFARLSAIEGELAEIERRESQEFEAIFPVTPAGRLESSLDRLEQYVLTLKRAEH